MAEIKGKTGLAEAFKVSRPTVSEWVRAGCPAERRGTVWYFDADKVQEWRRTRKAGKTAPEITKERARLTRLQADKKEIELRLLRGELIETVRAQATWGAVLGHFISRLEAMEHKLPPLVHGLSMPEIQEAVRKYIYEMRTELANPDLRELAVHVNRELKTKKEKTHGKSKKGKGTGRKNR